MSKRLQVVMGDKELREFRRLARAQHLTLSEWVRQTLRAARSGRPERSASRKLEQVRASAAHLFPSGDIGDMLAEIERGYLDDGKP